jgi:Tfp pilus assembly protein PilN
MMRRIDLLPETYAVRQQERRSIAIVVMATLLVLLLLIVWWVSLGSQVSGAQNDLAEAQARNAELQAKISELQNFADLQLEVQTKTEALRTVMVGDVDWPAVMTEIAMVIPGEVWLTNLNTSAANTEGAEQVPTETNEIRVNPDVAFGRIHFAGCSLTMPGVAKWLIRLGTAKEFTGIWLNTATAPEAATTCPVQFDSTLELGPRAASDRFERGLP